MSSTDLQFSNLLAFAAEGDGQQGVDRILERSMERLVRLARQMLREFPRLRRWEQTDDVVQDAAMRLCRSLREVQPRSTPDFFRLAALQIRRTLIDLARRHFGPHGNAGRYLSDPFLQTQNHRMQAQWTHEPQSLLEWTAFHEAVNELPDDERDAFSTVFYGGATYEQAAEVLGVSRRTVIRRMNRARLRLARCMSPKEAAPVEP